MNHDRPILPVLRTVSIAPGVRAIALGAVRAALRHAVMRKRRGDAWKYRDAVCTNISKTFDRVKWERERDGTPPKHVHVGVLEVDFVALSKRRSRNAN